MPGLRAQQANFAAAEKYDVANLKSRVGSDRVLPFFFKNSDRFWFIFDDEAGKNYYYVDPAKGVKTLLVDRPFILKKLAELRNEHIDSTGLTVNPPFNATANQTTVELNYKGSKYAYDFYEHKLGALPKENFHPAPAIMGTVSPDKKWVLYARRSNLYLKKNGDNSEIALSHDAAPYYSFDINEGDSLNNKNTLCNAIWLGNTGCFYVIRKDNRRVKTLSLVYSLAFPRPRVETYKYELPGDANVTQYELFIGNAATGKMLKVDAGKWPDQELSVVKADAQAGELFFLRKKRTRDEIELCAANMQTGAVRVIINEVSKPYINDELFNVSVLDKGKDILWWSDRSGWGHYYHYSGSGRLLNQVTRGNWTAGKLLRIDTAKNTIYFYGYGKEPGRNPYYPHAYKTTLDGKKQILLTPEDASHQVYFSSTGNYFLDNYSRINQTPVTVLRNNKGKLICELERPAFKKLFDYGWRTPEPFTIKAKDGVTDLYGIMWKPFDFDPSKKYPVISQVYPGPQTETVWTDFTVFDKYDNAPLAQLGCIVVCMGHRGGSPLRGKKYATYGYGNLRDAPLEDDKYGLEQLAQRFSYIDITRVGIFGHSGGAMMATAAICTYPGFYKVAVASSGNHDDNIYNRNWGEGYQGIKEFDDTTKVGIVKTSFKFKTDVNQTLAKNLKGHLLLVTGETDQNVHPGNTYRMVDALIRANKDFDMLVLPGQSHHYDEVYQTFFEHKKWQYFAKYLLENSVSADNR
ncbi:peptidase S9 [Mucilaginibacter sp. PPCGB 2223]|uniref:S9 family peptidase n=1 Tax=Mucilaginibacter sp. PPCGB 2223 TaxID=1886027 RepID=UPI000826E871|nr:DPP IV N-terminal domain-containing protein [Mucilaginibacter sp. PPCGB 2223]OCX52056.1 peptidase S9 [Mucilaginibacter sp. PPCGB 2223]